jgi:hypothetical protein
VTADPPSGVAAAKLSEEDETPPENTEVTADPPADDAVDHEPTFGLPPGETSFDKDSDAEYFMGRVSHRVSNNKKVV